MPKSERVGWGAVNPFPVEMQNLADMWIDFLLGVKRTRGGGCFVVGN